MKEKILYSTLGIEIVFVIIELGIIIASLMV